MLSLVHVPKATLGINSRQRRFPLLNPGHIFTQISGGQNKLRQSTQARSSVDEKQNETPYTPFSLISYDTSPLRLCHHDATITVDATPEKCFEIWDSWPRLLDFLDLIGKIHRSEEMPEEVATLFCYYRWANTPIMEIMVTVEKYDVKANKSICFKSQDGMPIKGDCATEKIFDVKELASSLPVNTVFSNSGISHSIGGIVEFSRENNLTTVSFRFEHCIPTVYVQYNIGNFVVSTHIDDILKENMDVFKQIVEGKIAPQPQNELSEAEKQATVERFDEFIKGYEEAEKAKKLREEAIKKSEDELDTPEV